MKKNLKCYGRKNTIALETAATRAFFDEFNCQTNFPKKNIKLFENISCSSSGSIEKSNTSNLKFRGLYSILDERVESPTQKKNVSIKNKLLLKVKLKKYKGKRKFHKKVFRNVQCKREEPNWSSIYEHSLAVENACEKVRGFNFNDINKKYVDSKLALDKGNSKSISSKKKIEDNSIIVESLYPVATFNPSSFQKTSTNKDLKLNFDATKQNSLFSPHESKRRNSNTSSLKFPLLTSTPLIPSKKIPGKYVNVFNLSAISTSNGQRKKELLLESSFASKISTPNLNQSKSLKLPSSTSSHKNSEYLQNKLSAKSHSNIDRSFFLKSDSCLKKVSIKGSDDPSILHKLLELCYQTETVIFMEAYDWKKLVFRKVGEGSYGEVFMCTKNKKSIITKVIPVSEDFHNNLQSMESVYSEIKVSLCLNKLRFGEDYRTRNFSLLTRAFVVQGAYPVKLLGAWDSYSNTKTTYNDRPDMFDEQQIFVILESEYGGKDMSSFVFRNAVEAESVLKQTAISLAIAEETHLFEHRDLHLGNILVQRNKSKSISYKFRGKSISIASEGLLVTIIDFTLSRILDDGCVYYNDLAEDSLFNQQGDYQFDVYRETKFQLKNQWHECLLYSNVLWLNFLCVKFEEHEYSRPSTIKHKKSLQNVKVFAEKLKTCKSALDCLIKCSIVSSLPVKTKEQNSKQNSEIFFIDRKSFQQKSNL